MSHHLLLSQIFKISLRDSNNTSNETFLPELSETISKDLSYNNFDPEVWIDSLIIERIQYPPSSTNSIPMFDYLLDCYVRTESPSSKISGKVDKSYLEEIQSRIASYMVLVLCYPSMCLQDEPFMSANSSAVIFVDALERSVSSSRSISGPVFSVSSLNAIMKEFSISDMFENVINGIMTEIMSRTLKITSPPNPFDQSSSGGGSMNSGEFLKMINVLYMVISNPIFAETMIKSPLWCPKNVNGYFFEISSFLGPFLRFSTLPDINPIEFKKNFDGITTRGNAYIHDIITSFQGALGNIHTQLHSCFLFMLRNKVTRESVLDFIGTSLELNKDRSKMSFNRKTTSTSGFMINLSSVLVDLCQPIIKKEENLSKIDPEYFVTGKRLDVKSETLISASVEDVGSWVDSRNHARIEQWKAQQSRNSSISSETKTMDFEENKSWNFITECFFLCARCFQLGPVSLITEMRERRPQVSRLKSVVKDLENSKPQWVNSSQSEENTRKLEAAKKQYELFKGMELAYVTMLGNANELQKNVMLFSYSANWLLLICDPEKSYPPLPEKVNKLFAMQPEFCMNNICEFLRFAVGLPGVLDVVDLNSLLTFLILFIDAAGYIRNPYMRANLVEILFLLGPGNQNQRISNSNIESTLSNNDVARKSLISSLMHFYVDVEFTGAHNQFYDKFNFRFYTAELITWLNKIPDFHSALLRFSNNSESFVNFVNMVINDGTHLLDETLNNLSKIHDHEKLRRDENAWKALSKEEKAQKEEGYSQSQRIASSDCQLANLTLRMLLMMSKNIIDPFMSDELVDRLAAMLNFNVFQLVGPRATGLRVDNPDQYSFNPRVMLLQLITIINNFGGKDRWIQAIVKDERSYTHETFLKAAGILIRHGGSEGQAMSLKFSEFINKVKEFSDSQLQEEDDLGDIPDEFLDPLMCDLMKDPVILPSSKVTIDRSTINQIYLNDKADPFNRQPLDINDIIPNEELRAKIQEWKSKKSKK